jgi:Tat protein secretion system quality control protein TatD with DNase activity
MKYLVVCEYGGRGLIAGDTEVHIISDLDRVKSFLESAAGRDKPGITHAFSGRKETKYKVYEITKELDISFNEVVKEKVVRESKYEVEIGE